MELKGSVYGFGFGFSFGLSAFDALMCGIAVMLLWGWGRRTSMWLNIRTASCSSTSLPTTEMIRMT